MRTIDLRIHLPGVRGCALALALLLVACGDGKRTGPTELREDEQRLVLETLDLMKLRLHRSRDAEGAPARRDSLHGLLDDEARSALLDRIAADPERAHLVAKALHESLQARKDRWFAEDL
jgi:hypothetical protein